MKTSGAVISLAILILAKAIPLNGQNDWQQLVADNRYNDAALLLATTPDSLNSDEATLALSEICRFVTDWEQVLPKVKAITNLEKLSERQINLLLNVCLFARPSQEELLDNMVAKVGVENLPLGSLSKAIMAYQTSGNIEKARRYDKVRSASLQNLLEAHKSLGSAGRRTVREQFRLDPTDKNLEAILYQTYCSMLLKQEAEVDELVDLLLAVRPNSPIGLSLTADRRLRQGDEKAALAFSIAAWNKSEVRALPLIVESLIAMKNRSGLRPFIDDMLRFRQTHPLIPFGLARYASTDTSLEDGRELFLKTFRGLDNDIIDENPALKDIMQECVKKFGIHSSDLRLEGAREDQSGSRP